MTRILISGSRAWNCSKLAARIIDRLITKYGAENLTIVNGAATGVDAAFAAAAKAAGVAVESHPADWDDLTVPGAVIRRNKTGKEYNANAGPKRNQIMVDAGATLMVAVHKSINWSRGTNGCVKLALTAGIPVYLIDSEDGEPKRLEEI